MRLPVNYAAAPLMVLALLSACGGGSPRAGSVPLPETSGPGADFPMVLGEPFTIGSTSYTPVDRMNYDAVGYAATGSEGGTTVTVAHKTMPLPSYLEVTALDTGKTILVRVERRGPMSNALLLELSPGAAAQLGVSGNPRAPVRARRVNPPEVERAMLRTGQAAPARMDTPRSLLTALVRKLETQDGGPRAVALPTPVATPTPSPTPTPRPVRRPPVAVPTPKPVATPTPAPRPAVGAPVTGQFAVQVAAFSARDRADAAAKKLGAQVVQSGQVWRVRMGPFATQAEAQAALAKAKAAGYSDARIQRTD
jgi:rare lipoprotein A